MIVGAVVPEAVAKTNAADVEYVEYENPVAEFTRSMAKLNRISEMCSDVITADYQNYALYIQHYVKLLYKGEAPYWVLAEVKERINDNAMCKWLVSEILIHYQFAYQGYVEVTKPALMPPVLTENMSVLGYAALEAATLGIARPSKH